MALNLHQAGHSLSVHARRPESMTPLAEAGAATAMSPAECAARSDVVFTMVSDTPDVEEVIFGPGGVAEGIAPGGVVVDMSTISPAATRSMAERLAGQGVQMLDAPVSGGDLGAINSALLSIMVGGEASAFERVLPLFQAMGENIVHIGASGAGQVCKACNQVVVGATIAGVAEAILLACSSGVDPARVREALLGGFAASRILEVHGRRMIEGDYARLQGQAASEGHGDRCRGGARAGSGPARRRPDRPVPQRFDGHGARRGRLGGHLPGAGGDVRWRPRGEGGRVRGGA